jgi:hypothetical protein
MDFWEFLGRTELQLPLTRDNEDFQGFVESKLDAYLTLLSELTTLPDYLSTVSKHLAMSAEFCSALKQTVRFALEGEPSNAYKCFSESLSSELPLLKELEGVLDASNPVILYRVRRETAVPMSREELFHVPFEERHKIATNRYSIPGLPCLYLAGSLYTCWCEMGHPPMHELQVAGLWLRTAKPLKVINFSDRPKRILRWLTPTAFAAQARVQRYAASYVLLWPLIAICSIIAKHGKGHFKPEYLVPQLLLQWVRTNRDFDGICYFSMHVPSVVSLPALPACNIVLPVRSIKAEGRCSYLRSLFKMTEPTSWQLLRAIRGAPGNPPFFDIEFVEGITEPYHDTEFGEVERKVRGLIGDIVSRNNAGDVDAGDIRE